MPLSSSCLTMTSKGGLPDILFLEHVFLLCSGVGVEGFFGVHSLLDPFLNVIFQSSKARNISY